MVRYRSLFDERGCLKYNPFSVAANQKEEHYVLTFRDGEAWFCRNGCETDGAIAAPRTSMDTVRNESGVDVFSAAEWVAI